MQKRISSATGWHWNRLAITLVLSCCLFHPVYAASSVIRYSYATLLKVRAKPATQAAVVAKWPINQSITLLNRTDSGWCEVELPDGSQRGFVDCSFLHPEPLTLEQIETEAAKTVLAFNRQTMTAGQDSYTQQQPDDNQKIYKSFDTLFTLLERQFAISPSLYTYADYNRLLQVLHVGTGEPLSDSESYRLNQLAMMRESFTQDFSLKETPPVRHPISQRLNLLLQKRRYGDIERKAKPGGPGSEEAKALGVAQPAEKASFFTGNKWAAGWAGGGLVRRLRTKEPDGVGYSLVFDGTGPWALADVYEMAKSLHVAVKARFGKASDNTGLSQMMATTGTGPESLILELRMPIWAVTEEGLVAGTLRRVSFGGDACAGETEIPTAAEIVLVKPAKGDIQGVFASSVPIDPTQAVVTIRKRNILAPLYSDETTFTHRVDMSVDLDGDGVADLRTLVSNDTSVSSSGKNGFMHAVATGRNRYFRRVAGWYANDIYMLQANEDGWWRTLSRYDVVTCT